MHVIYPILRAISLAENTLYRLLKVNFGAMLDIPNAIANDILWRRLIHHL